MDDTLFPEAQAPSLPDLPKRGRPKSNKMSFVTAVKPKIGRPKQFFWTEHKELMRKCFAEGMSLVEVAVKLGVTKDFLWREQKKIPEFGLFLVEMRQLSEAWWIAKGRTALTKGKLKVPLYQLMMMNLHNWNNKQKLESEQTVKLVELPDNIIDGLVNKIVEDDK